MRGSHASAKSKFAGTQTARCAARIRRSRNLSSMMRRSAPSRAPETMTWNKMKGLVCRECGKEYPAVSLHVCELCFGPLEVQYDYKQIQATLTRKKIENGP